MTLILALAVGTCWGVTNVAIKNGVLRAEQRRQRSTSASGLSSILGQHWAALLSIPSFVLPQLVNWAASIALVLALADSKLHIATPVANAVSIAANAATARLVFAERLNLGLVVAGSICIAVGVALTGS